MDLDLLNKPPPPTIAKRYKIMEYYKNIQDRIKRYEDRRNAMKKGPQPGPSGGIGFNYYSRK